MGRGRGKGKKSSAIAAREDTGSAEEEKVPARRRGRPQKPLKDDTEEEEEEVEKLEDEEDSEIAKDSVLDKDAKNVTAADNGKKRKKPSLVKETEGPVKPENGVGNTTNANDLIKSVGFRPNGSRRKNKPRRAAEVGVECR